MLAAAGAVVTLRLQLEAQAVEVQADLTLVAQMEPQVLAVEAVVVGPQALAHSTAAMAALVS
jgi:hypothetical protein